MSMITASPAEPRQRQSLVWHFPLRRTHTGMPLANGVQGLLVWGSGRSLHITVGRAGFWDHRGGNDFQSATTFSEVKRLLQRNDEAGLREVFGHNDSVFNTASPHQVGGGQVDLELPPGWQLSHGQINLNQGVIEIVVASANSTCRLVLRQAIDQELAWLELPEQLASCTVTLHASWQWTGQQLAELGCQAPKTWTSNDDDATTLGFAQHLPADDPLAMVVRHDQQHLRISTALGPDARSSALVLLQIDINHLAQAATEWWQNYWHDVPWVDLPDTVCQELIDYGLYLQACVTPPQGLACTLQGPFLEAHQIPPWSCDYHFNINIQMIYQAALASNRLSHFAPLWKLILSWWPSLQQGAARFFDAPEAIMLPHAVDDRCQVVGSFWTGSIDHGCTAWMALLAWDHCRYGHDTELLREVAWPMLRGAFAGWWAMMETNDDGSMHLPVSVSPEYKGCRMDAWGQDASFQLAAAHATAQALQQAAAWLGQPLDPRWQQLRDQLPAYTSITAARFHEYPEMTSERIALWAGQDLEGSHRHHSHLAGITPFRTLDPHGPDREIIANSLEWWTRLGPGGWSGWCVPWAAMIHARCGQVDAAVSWLHIWQQAFTNEGRGSLHDADFRGLSGLASGHRQQPDSGQHPAEIMQLDGRFGALSAVMELLVHEANGEIRVLPQLPRDWPDGAFGGIRAPGAFLIDATFAQHQVTSITVTSEAGGTLRLCHPWAAAQVGHETLTDSVIVAEMVAGQQLSVTPAELNSCTSA